MLSFLYKTAEVMFSYRSYSLLIGSFGAGLVSVCISVCVCDMRVIVFVRVHILQV